MMSARRASLLVGAILFAVISAALMYTLYSLDLYETFPPGLAIVGLVVAVLMALLVSLAVRLGLLAARRNPVGTGTALTIALVYSAVWLVIGVMPDKGLEVVSPDNEFETIVFVLLQALIGVTLLPAAITYVVALTTRVRRRDA